MDPKIAYGTFKVFVWLKSPIRTYLPFTTDVKGPPPFMVNNEKIVFTIFIPTNYRWWVSNHVNPIWDGVGNIR